jgi:ligand-binding sensor domain-containing protein
LNGAFLKYCLFSLILLAGAGNACHAQSFTTRLYTTADGLTDNYILCVYQDSYGYLWIGTVNGLNRFDGKNFINFRVRQGLPSPYVDQVYEDHLHRLWIGTRAGLAELRGDSCYAYPVSDKQEVYYVSGFVEPDASHLWATTNAGIYEFRKNMWVKISLVRGYENRSVGKIIKTTLGLFVNYENTKLIWKQPGGKSETIFSVEANRPYYNSLFAKHDTLYMGTYTGLRYWCNDKWIPQFEDTLANKKIYTSFADNEGRFWFGTATDGILTISPTEKEIKYFHIPLSYNLVSRFIEDHDKNIWVAGFEGLVKVSPSAYKPFALPEFKTLKSIRRFIMMPSGAMLVSGENGKLLLLKQLSTTNSFRTVSAMHLKDSDDFIMSSTFDERNRLWFTSRNGLLYRFDGKSLIDFSSALSSRNNVLNDIAYNKKTKQLYVCGDSVLFKGNENSLDTFFGNGKKQFIRVPYKIFLNEETGSMLVQTLQDGLFKITGSGEFIPLGRKIDLYLSAQDISASQNNEQSLWAVYPGRCIAGFKWKPSQLPQPTESISDKEEVFNNTITDIVFDKEGKMWLATAKGVTVLQRNEKQKWMYHDMPINEPGIFTPLSFSKLGADSSGNIWMNLRDKFLVFDAKKTVINPLMTKTLIEKILLFDRATDWSSLTDSIDGYRQLPLNPRLKYNQNTLSIAFNALQYNDNSQLEYSYRLRPLDTSWGNPSPGNVVSFYQLNPGSYRFEVRSHIKGFDWSEPASFSFAIEKPFWETWWLRTLVILTAAALIVLIFRFRLKQLRTKTEMQNQLRELELKAFKLQMNPHFIHNALNSIQSLVINNRNNEASLYINKFARLLRQILENSDKNLISLDKELYSLQLYIDLEKLRMDMDVDYIVQLGELITPSEIKIPPLLLQPFVENALWHGLSKKEGHKKITLDIHDQEGWLICKITDNGIGRKKAAELYETFPEGHLSKAVNIIRDRLYDFNQSSANEPVSFIDLGENGNPAGTSVVVQIKIQ